MSNKYKNTTHLGQRVIESTKILEKFPNRVPIIVERADNIKTDIPYIDKNKFLVPGDLSFGQFIFVIRRRLQLPPEKALFLFVKNMLIPSSSMMKEVYNDYKDNDGFLYVIYSGESVFGYEI